MRQVARRYSLALLLAGFAAAGCGPSASPSTAGKPPPVLDDKGKMPDDPSKLKSKP